MTVFWDLFRHDVITFPEGNCRFEAKMPGDFLLIEKIDTRKPFVPFESRFEELWARGQVKRHIVSGEKPA